MTHGIISPGMLLERASAAGSTSLVGMSRFCPNIGFLVLLPSPSVHDHMISANTGLNIGQAKLQHLPWTRLAGAEVLKLPFKVCLCIEGASMHVCQPSIIRQLLPQGTLFECIDKSYRNENEAHCCCITVWSKNLDLIAKEVAIWLEELQGQPTEAWHFADLGDGRRPRSCPIHVLSYDVVIHIDQIIDLRASTVASASWPERHSFKWWLGFHSSFMSGLAVTSETCHHQGKTAQRVPLAVSATPVTVAQWDDPRDAKPPSTTVPVHTGAQGLRKSRRIRLHPLSLLQPC
jgi:hypothetical protein